MLDCFRPKRRGWSGPPGIAFGWLDDHSARHPLRAQGARCGRVDRANKYVGSSPSSNRGTAGGMARASANAGGHERRGMRGAASGQPGRGLRLGGFAPRSLEVTPIKPRRTRRPSASESPRRRLEPPQAPSPRKSRNGSRHPRVLAPFSIHPGRPLSRSRELSIEASDHRLNAS